MVGLHRMKEILAPASLEAVYRRIMGSAHSIEKDVSYFRQTQLFDLDFAGDWKDFLLSLCRRHNIELERDLQDVEDLKQLIESELKGEALSPNKTSKSGLYRQTRRKTMVSNLSSEKTQLSYTALFDATAPKDFKEFKQLSRVAERGKLYDFIAVSIWSKLENLVAEHVQKYCLSFEQEARGLQLESVREYQNKIIAWNTDIQSRLDMLKTLLDEHDAIRSSMGRYVDEYERAAAIMQESCDVIFRVIEVIKKWVSCDASYARRIQDEINQKHKLKTELKERIKCFEENRDNMRADTRRKAFHCVKHEEDMQRLQDHKRHLKRRQHDLQMAVEQQNQELKRRHVDLDDVKIQLATRKDNSVTLFNYMSSLTEALKKEMRGIEGRIRTDTKQLSDLSRDLAASQRHIDTKSREMKETQRIYERVCQPDEMDCSGLQWWLCRCRCSGANRSTTATRGRRARSWQRWRASWLC